MTENQKDFHLRLSRAFLPMMHIFHHMAVDVVKLTDFSLAQYRVLMLVYNQGSMSINELSANLNIAQSTASEMIDRLVNQKILRKKKHPQDRRITLFTLTPKSQKIIMRHLASISRIYEKLLDPLTPAEQEKLVTGFETILELLQKSRSKNHIYKQTRKRHEQIIS